MFHTFLFFFIFLISIHSKIIGAFILPHGDNVLDPEIYKKEEELYNLTKQLHDSYVKASGEIAKLNPDMIFLTTPHGVALQKNFAVYLNEKGKGDANSNEGDFSKFKVNVTLDYDFSNELVETLVSEGYCNVETIVGYSESDSFPMGWGEVIPMWFLENITRDKFNYSVLSFPRRRLTEEVKMVDELLHLGELVFPILDNFQKDIIIIISADLSHVHKNKFGPNPFPIREEIAKEFDSLIEKWIETMNKSYLLETVKIADLALSCGFTEFFFLEGLMEKARDSGIKLNSELIQKPLAPTWFGMAMGKILFS